MQRVAPPAVTAAQMREIDRAMVEDLGVEILQMMESAGRTLAGLARRLAAPGAQILVLAGTGNNGGGGLAAARHLHNWGVPVTCLLLGDEIRATAARKRQTRILRAMGAPVEPFRGLTGRPGLIVEAISGYAGTGPLRGELAAAVELANGSGAPILALDVPTGLDPDTGLPGSPCIRAVGTLTLGLPKVGLLAPQAAPYVGKVYVADIGVPPALIEQVAGRPFQFAGPGTIQVEGGPDLIIS